MSEDVERLALARRDARERRARLTVQFAATRQRLSPRRLRSDIRRKVRRTTDNGLQSARRSIVRHPVLIGVMTTLAAAYLFRGPIARAWPRLRTDAASAWQSLQRGSDDQDRAADNRATLFDRLRRWIDHLVERLKQRIDKAERGE